MPEPNPGPSLLEVERILSDAETLRIQRGDPEVFAPHLFAAVVERQDIQVQAAFRRARLDPELTSRLVLATLEHAPAALPTETLDRVSHTLRTLIARSRSTMLTAASFVLYAVTLPAADRLDRADTAEVAESLRQLGRDLYSQMDIKTELDPAQSQSIEQRSALDIGHDLTEAARRGDIHPVYGRAAELLQMIAVLSGRGIRNPVVLGSPGVGKTALVEGLAVEIARGRVPASLRSARIVAVEIGALVAGTNYRGTFEARIQKLLDAAASDPGLILFIDEVHMLMGAGGSDSFDTVNAANMLKPALTDGRLRLIGATTDDEYRRFIEADGALARRFSPIVLEEPAIEVTRTILRDLRCHLEEFHDVTLDAAAIDAALDLSVRYMTGRCLPDKAIRLLDRACSQRRLRQFYGFDDLRNLSSEEQQALFESASSRVEPAREETRVTVPDVELAVSEAVNVPVGRLREEETHALLHLEDRMSERVLGQPAAVRAVAETIRVARVGLGDRHRPIGTFLRVGPTGTGKTELAKAVAFTHFGDEDSLIRVDMSECHDHSFINRLIGSPAGYVGSDRGGLLTEAIQRRPYSVVLLDEIEKADHAVHMLLLGLLDEGWLTDGRGRRVDCRNTIVMMTSNIGCDHIGRRWLGFGSESVEPSASTVDADTHTALRRVFPAEFLNRIDRVLVFRPLSQDTVSRVVRKMLLELPVRVQATESALHYLAQRGYEPSVGARPLRRCIQAEVIEPLASMVLRKEIDPSCSIMIDLADEQLVFTEEHEPPSQQIENQTGVSDVK